MRPVLGDPDLMSDLSIQAYAHCTAGSFLFCLGGGQWDVQKNDRRPEFGFPTSATIVEYSSGAMGRSWPLVLNGPKSAMAPCAMALNEYNRFGLAV